MKKRLTIFLALICVSVMGWATQYCNHALVNGTHTVYFSAYKVSEGNYQIKITSAEDMNGLSAGCYMNVNGAGGYQMLPHSTVSADKKTITVDIAGTPGTIYNPLYIMMPGEVSFTGVQNVDIDWSATCSAGDCTDETAPTVTAVSAGSITHNSVVLTVTANDNDGGSGIVQYIVKNGDTQIASNATSPITVTGLSSGTTYDNIKVIAKDGCNNESSAFAVSSFTTENRASECEGDLGHFASPSTKRIHYKIEYLPTTNKIRYEVRGYGSQVLDFCQIQTTSGNSDNLRISDGVAIWKQDAPAAGTEMGILFVYSTDAIGGNEMNAENTSSFTGNNAHLVYYKSRDCEADPEPAYAPTTTPEESTIFNDCQIYSIFGTQYYAVSGFNGTTHNWGGGSATTETIDGREVLHVAGSNGLLRGFETHDVSGFTHLHFDVWCAEAKSMTMKLMAYNDGWREADAVAYITSKGAWKSIDLALADFNHSYLNEILGIYPQNMQNEDIYLTNIYFYKTTDDVACYETLNIAEGKPSEGGFVPGNAGEVPAKANDGNEGTLWVTYANRPASEEWWYVDLMNNYAINKIEVVWGADYSTNYILQTRTEAPSEADKADDAAWVTVATVTDAAANSTKTNTLTSATGRYVRFHSLSRSSNCIRLAELRVFATGYAVTDVNDPVISTAEVADDSENATSVKLHLVAADEEDGAVKSFLLNKGDDSWLPIVTDASDTYTESDLTRGHYSYQVKARDHAGNVSEISTINFDIFNPADNLAINQDVVAGYTPTNPAEVPTKANDGNLGTPWTTYNQQPMDVQWWSVDLGDVYQLANIDLFWGVRSNHYLLQVAHAEPADRSDDSQWYTVREVDETQQTGTSEENKNRYAINASARYVRFKALSKDDDTFLKLWELRVFGSAYADADNNAPVISTATVSYDEGNAYITLLASDTEDGTVKTFRVVNATTGDKSVMTTNGDNQIIIEGLSPNTLYEYEIQAMDKAANLSTVRAVNVNVPISANGNVALDKPVVAGFETGNSGEAKGKANDGNESTYWATWATGDVTREWLYVDLEGLYDLKRIVVKFDRGLVSSDYILQYRREVPTAEQAADDDAWTTIAEVTTASEANLSVSTNATGVARYVRFRTKTANVRLAEIEVYVNAAILPLDDSQNNASHIAANDGANVNVEFTRTFSTAGEWYTICLPFDLTNEQLIEVFGAGYQLAEMVGAEDRGSMIHLNFDYVSALTASKAYMLKPSVAVASAPTFEGVTIKNVAPIVSGNGLMHFQGTYNQITLNADNQRFIGPSNYLYSPAEGGTNMGAFRCYFEIPAGSPAPGRPARVVMAEENTTGIPDIDSNANVKAAKLLRNGELLIQRDEHLYNAQGMLIR